MTKENSMDTDCSSCRVDLKIDTDKGTVSAGKAKTEYFFDGDMFTWDCPVCGEADSYWPEV